MKKGDVVMVYQDPITETKPEGKAELLKFLASDGELEYWQVRFVDDEDKLVVPRFIRIKDNDEIPEQDLSRIDFLGTLYSKYDEEDRQHNG